MNNSVEMLNERGNLLRNNCFHATGQMLLLLLLLSVMMLVYIHTWYY